MSRPSSSTSSSEAASPHPTRGRRRAREVVNVSLWTCVFLALLDVGVNLAFPYPRDPRIAPDSSLAVYFEYGRSLEGKLARMIGPTAGTSSPLALAGWLSPDLGAEEPRAPAPGSDLLVAIYGQSFSEQAGRAMQELDPTITLRVLGGPAAPASHSHAAFLADRGRHRADVVVLGILSSSVAALDAASGTTWQFEGPAPYTFPRYSLRGDELIAATPPVGSYEELQGAWHDPARWRDYRDWLRAHDRFYSPLLFRRNALDASALFRIARRAWAQKNKDAVLSRTHQPGGFREDSEAVGVLRALAVDFAAVAVRDGRRPVLLLIHDHGFSDHLIRVLRPAMERHGIPFVSTHEVVSAEEPANFIPDGHFTPEANRKIAMELIRVVRSRAD